MFYPPRAADAFQAWGFAGKRALAHFVFHAIFWMKMGRTKSSMEVRVPSRHGELPFLLGCRLGRPQGPREGDFEGGRGVKTLQAWGIAVSEKAGPTTIF